MNQQAPHIDLTHLGKQTTHMINNFIQQQGEAAENMAPIMRGFVQLSQSMLQDPQKLIQRQFDLYQSTLALWANLAERAMGKEEVPPLTTPEKGDRRFNAAAWQENMMFDFIKQSYLLYAKWLLDAVHDSQGLDAKTREKVDFYTRQYLDALSPSNFPLTNPDVLQATVESNGQNLLDGLQNLLNDLQQGHISMTDYSAFEVGKNIATTPGQVVYRNRMFELIQYNPGAGDVYQRPLLISPPWINRYYILDLQPHNSLVKFAVDQGMQVFMISWKNPDETYRDTSFEDYMRDGLLKAMDVVQDITGAKDMNLVGYCIGGTLLGATLAVLKKKGDTRVNSATFLTTLMDFENAGELEVFIDEEQLTALENKMAAKGYLDGREMAATFSMLRANDLIWNFVINNYLMGKQPFPFDILYWNDDPTRMPAAMHSYYLRNMYLENNLVKKDKLTLLDEKVDLSAIDVPVYMLCGIQDHITPWETCYRPLANMASKEKTFTLNNTGHVAGVACPPAAKGKPVKRAYWSGDVKLKTPAKWLEKQQKQEDSWWPHWGEWLQAKAGDKMTAPKTLGNNKHRPLEPAPGNYVKERY
jgi:polyhydroxyalkanoate synthase